MMKEIVSYQTHKQTGRLLNANEMSNNLNETIRKEIQEKIADLEFNRYPDDECLELRSMYAKVMNLDVEKVMAGNGSDQILGLLIGYFLGKGKSLLTLMPDFSMYDYYVASYEAEIKKYQTNEDGSFDVDNFIQFAHDEKVSMILFSNPNNPTGYALNNEELEKILSSCVDIPVVIDEAYAEFANESALDLVDRYSNLFVTRTLSKAYGLASARLGFLVSNKLNVAKLKKANVPYVLNSISQLVGTIVLTHADEFAKLAQETKKQRDMYYTYNYKSIKFFKSQGNYIMIKCSNLEKLLGMFKSKDIVVREYQGQDYFRLTIGNKEDNQIVKEIFDQFEKEETLCVK